MEQIPFDLETEAKKVPELFSDLQPHIVEAFWQYHRENEHVYDLFCQFARDVRQAGRSNYGVGAIFERIRWHYAVETKGDEFKLNNNYRSCYARLLVLKDPSFADFFQMRRTPGTVIAG